VISRLQFGYEVFRSVDFILGAELWSDAGCLGYIGIRKGIPVRVGVIQLECLSLPPAVIVVMIVRANRACRPVPDLSPAGVLKRIDNERGKQE
jgi:hypothetical protein